MSECYFDICPYHSTNLYVDEESPLCFEEECHVPEEDQFAFSYVCSLINQFGKEVKERNNV